jgi:PAS domain-containing protein
LALYTYVNERAAHLLGKAKDQLIGPCVWDSFPEIVGTEADQKGRQALAEQVSEVFKAFHPVLGEWYEHHVYPAMEGTSIYWRDITERTRVPGVSPPPFAPSRRLPVLS